MMLSSPAMGRNPNIQPPQSVIPGIAWPGIPNQQDNILLSLLFQLEQSQW